MKPKVIENFVLIILINGGQWGNHVGESYNDTLRYNVQTKFMFCDSTDIYFMKLQSL